MPYPDRLIPDAKNDVIIDKPDPDEILCRWVPSKETLFDANGNLSLMAAITNEQSKHIYNFQEDKGYSINKISPSKADDVYIGFYNKEYFNQKWGEGEEGATVNDEDFYYTDGGHFFLRIGDFHKHEGLYPFPRDQEPNLRYVLQVIHVPLIANIAHFEFKVTAFDSDNNALADLGKGPRKELMHFIKNRILKLARLKYEDF